MNAVVQTFKEVYGYRELLLALTYRDIRVKYKQAAMGMLWAVFLPVLAICSGVILRLAMAIFAGRTLQVADIAAIMVKSVPWLLFASIVSGSSQSLVGSISLITKIYFPRQVVPLSQVLSALVDFCISVSGLAVLLGVLWLWSGEARPPIVISWQLLWVPLLLLNLLVLATALGLIASCANLFLRDVKYLVQVLLQFGIFFSLVFFSYTELGRWGKYLLINPVAPILEAIRSAAVQGAVDPALYPWLAYSAAAALLLLAAGCSLFGRAEALFAEYA